MKGLLIILCRKCKRPSLAFEGAKSKICPYCGVRELITSGRILAKASSPEEARALISAYKRRRRQSVFISTDDKLNGS
ncbi:MAG: DUF1922 domain-containing protein [Candidatus Bathyarchaeia archaeon]